MSTDTTLSERTVVGTLLLHPQHVPLAMSRLAGPEDFGEPRCFAAYEAICDTWRELGTADAPTVVTMLGGDAGDWRVWLIETAETYGYSAANIEYHLRIVREGGRLRKLRAVAEQIRHECDTAAEVTEARDIASRAVDALTRAAGAAGRSEGVPIAKALQAVMERLERADAVLRPTGLDSFDRLAGGIPGGKLVTVMGVPGSGKSTWVYQVIRHWATLGHRSVVFSFEMDAESIAAGMLSAESGLPVNRWRMRGERPGLEESREVAGAVDRLSRLGIEFVEENVDARQILDRCLYERTRGVDTVVIDYVQNLPPLPGTQTEQQSIAESVRICQRISRNLGMTVFMVSQIDKAASRENRAPKKSDGFGAAAIDMASDFTIGVHRPCVGEPRGAEESDADWNARKYDAQLHVLKNKAGPTGAASCYFEGAAWRFVDHLPSGGWRGQ